MFFSLWRRLWSSSSGPSRGAGRHRVRQVSRRPQLDSLEDRLLPALGVGDVLGLSAAGLTYDSSADLRVEPAPMAGPLPGLQQPGGLPTASANPMRVTLDTNSTDSVLDLGAVFAARREIHPKGGLQLSILGNTNPGLVVTDLSGADLTLTYARGKSGTATITVGATDADGVSVRETILVTVNPLQPPRTTVPAPVLPSLPPR